MTTRETLTFASEAEWLAMRAKDLTSTEAAALFDASPYFTEFELHHIKTGRLTKDFQENERMKWGTRLESAIATGIAEDFGLIVEPFKVYMRIPKLRMGSSFDFKIVGVVDGHESNHAREMFLRHGPGIMEVKNVDGLQFRRAWIDDGDEIEAPPHIEFQVQHQLEVADLNWSLIAPLVGGNTPKPVIRERDREIGALIAQRVAHFWARVDAGVAPEPNYANDADTISKLYVDNDGSALDLTDNPRVYELCKEYKAAGADEKAAQERKRAARAELLTIIEAAKSVRAAGFSISAGTRKETFRAYNREAGERVTITITKVDAATIEAAVPAYRDVRITEKAA
ncbi:YqaJ viral recombinase family protein [Burkholderia multivorans]|uniref:YqaJ viral recombinase family nuclease n=1 Tax=Burkholderia multivorans TaxID=87883 RepID=UPI001C215F61|nr:YqaJ viral recombinase family protein [Burkholderia multivorans]MBU9386593.1 YqaJ viral recombinase family protein [Burkholderia multivorans]MBU9437026.1 YqaJ viral recombinase family protein [Burkholderia multivorans]MBU9606233.1 YqaJ viral recombinase family protein [Burkholderia multivorans]MBU9624792.1 YqaJ viral recombinase family protein [Burkholderia multivorans]MDN7510936.1 YqaJ viral recombinase family protein [Burkholderia multivorans]